MLEDSPNRTKDKPQFIDTETQTDEQSTLLIAAEAQTETKAKEANGPSELPVICQKCKT